MAFQGPSLWRASQLLPGANSGRFTRYIQSDNTPNAVERGGPTIFDFPRRFLLRASCPVNTLAMQSEALTLLKTEWRPCN